MMGESFVATRLALAENMELKTNSLGLVFSWSLVEHGKEVFTVLEFPLCVSWLAVLDDGLLLAFGRRRLHVVGSTCDLLNFRIWFFFGILD